MGRDRDTGTVKVFKRADILIPVKEIDLNKWCVIACDQFTSDPEYWDEVEKIVGDSPSTLRLILPEAYLGRRDKDELKADIGKKMEEYLNAGYFNKCSNCLIYIERKLSNGKIRKGLIGMIDLEHYSYLPDVSARIVSSEGTILSRLPDRADIRRNASLELPHIILFIDDREDGIINKSSDSEELYSVSLMQGGGELKAFRLSDSHAEEIEELVANLSDKSPIAVGDGNHSLAAAKLIWEEAKENLTVEEEQISPLRYALVELQNIYDSAVDIEAIHRVLLNCDTYQAIDEIEKELSDESPDGLNIELIYKNGKKQLKTRYAKVSELIEHLDELLKKICDIGKGEIDFIHGEKETEDIGRNDNNLGILLPGIKKGDIFSCIKTQGPYPRKSFSVEEARDKRYYLEAREIV